MSHTLSKTVCRANQIPMQRNAAKLSKSHAYTSRMFKRFLSTTLALKHVRPFPTKPETTVNPACSNKPFFCVPDKHFKQQFGRASSNANKQRCNANRQRRNQYTDQVLVHRIEAQARLENWPWPPHPSFRIFRLVQATRLTLRPPIRRRMCRKLYNGNAPSDAACYAGRTGTPAGGNKWTSAFFTCTLPKSGAKSRNVICSNKKLISRLRLSFPVRVFGN